MMGALIIAVVAILAAVTMVLCGQGMIAPNSVIGIRIPSFLASDADWRTGHRAAVLPTVVAACACVVVVFAVLFRPALGDGVGATLINAALALVGLIIGAIRGSQAIDTAAAADPLSATRTATFHGRAFEGADRMRRLTRVAVAVVVFGGFVALWLATWLENELAAWIVYVVWGLFAAGLFVDGVRGVRPRRGERTPTHVDADPIQAIYQGRTPPTFAETSVDESSQIVDLPHPDPLRLPESPVPPLSPPRTPRSARSR